MDPERVTVVPNSRDLDRYRHGDATGLAAELDIPQDAVIIGNVGRLIERKGQFDVLEAWPRIKEAHPNAHCVFVGDGSEREALREQVASMGYGESIHLVGTRDDIPALLDLFDVFVFPRIMRGSRAHSSKQWRPNYPLSPRPSAATRNS